jgi:hypothetical protein
MTCIVLGIVSVLVLVIALLLRIMREILIDLAMNGNQF